MSLFRFAQWISAGQPVLVYGDGTQERDFTYIDDIARGTIAALRPLGYEVINLGSDEPVMRREAMHLSEELVDRPAAERFLNWSPQILFEEGVARLMEWYQAERAWASTVCTR